jgi:hypothetical protein
MKFVTLYPDGSTFPALEANKMVIRLGKGGLAVGLWKTTKYKGKESHFIAEPENSDDLMLEAVAWLNAQIPVLLSIRQTVLIICPAKITSKAKWHKENNPGL